MGRLVRYVGTSPTLSGVVQEIASRVEESGLVHPSPQTWKIFLRPQPYGSHFRSRASGIFCAVAREIGRPPGRTGNP
jgi:hypothetical protein